MPTYSTQKLKIWLTTVAAAAPRTPIRKAKMNRGSNPMFSTAPDTRPIMEKKAFPWKRIWLFSTQEERTKGAPKRRVV